MINALHPALRPLALLLLITGVLFNTSTTSFAAKPAPILIVRDTGGFAGPDFDFMVFPDHTWQFIGRDKSKGKKQGKTTAATVTALIKTLVKAGLSKAKSIRPSPAPHSQILIRRGKKVHSVFLSRDHKLMPIARAAAMKIVNGAK